MALGDIIDVRISREIPVVSRVGFGTPVFVTEGTTFPAGTVNSYGDMDEVAEDYDSTDDAFQAAQAAFAQDSGLQAFKVYHKDADDMEEAWGDVPSNISAVDDDWYCILIESRDAADIEAVSNAVEALNKLFIAASADADILDGQVDNDIASTLLDQNLSRTALIYHSEADSEYPDAAWAGLQLPEDPGSTTWAFKTLSGIPTDSLSSSELQALRDKRCNHYISVAGNSITYEGYTSEPGVFIDIIRGLDWLRQRMAEDIFSVLASTSKVPYIGGAEILEQSIRGRLDIAVDRDVIVDGYDVNVPPASSQSASDRADRIYRDITFEAQLTGAVHRVEVRGTVTV